MLLTNYYSPSVLKSPKGVYTFLIWKVQLCKKLIFQILLLKFVLMKNTLGRLSFHTRKKNEKSIFCITELSKLKMCKPPLGISKQTDCNILFTAFLVSFSTIDCKAVQDQFRSIFCRVTVTRQLIMAVVFP